MGYLVSKEQQKLITHVKNKIDVDTTMKQLLDEFGFEFYSLPYTYKVGGLYSYDEKYISIHEKYWDKEDKDPWSVFVHEFGHLVHQLSSKIDFYHEYRRNNLLFSQLLESEQQASLIGLEIWKWKFPHKRLESIPYFSNDDIQWLADYYRPYFENDVELIC